MGVTEISYSQSMVLIATEQLGKPTKDVEKGTMSSMLLENSQQKCPYDYLARDGVIEYNGVTFVCDYKNNAICLGDMSNPKKILNISLPSGGTLKVNINNFGDLAKAAGMFSPADLNAIMKAIAQYKHCTSKRNEIDEEKLTTWTFMESGAAMNDRLAAEKMYDENKGKLRKSISNNSAYGNNDCKWEQALGCKEAEESTEDNPVYEVTTTVNGKTYTKKIHVNDVMPSRATQAEMYALFTYHDSVNGTENSYEKFAAYMDIAQLHGYLKGNDTYSRFVNDTYNWREILPEVIEDASNLGLQNVVSEGWALHDTIEKAFISKIDFDVIKENINFVQGELTYTMPDIPKDISNVIFSGILSEEYISRFGDQNLSILEDKIERRIAEQIDSDGTRGQKEGMWNSAVSVLESLCNELDSFFGDKPGNWDSEKQEAARLKQMYESIINDLQEAREDSSGDKGSALSEDDNLKQMLADYIAVSYEKIKNGDTKQEFQIGSLSLTLEEWDELIENFDDLEDEIREELKAEIEKYMTERDDNIYVN